MAQQDELTRYLHKVSRNLHCPRHVKKSILQSIRGDIGVAIEKNDLTSESIVAVFGSPHEIAHTYLEGYDQEILRVAHLRSRLIMAISVFVSLLCILFVIFVIQSLQSHAAVIIENGVYTISSYPAI